MPNRFLKESIRTSKKVNGMTDFQFRVWAYLITYVDDFGRGSAEPDILKGFVFPRRKSVTEANIRDALREMACMGLIQLYEVDGESYLCFPNWEKHQSRRAVTSKFPAPDEGCKQLQTDENGCNQLQSDAPVFDIRNSVFDIRESSSVSDAPAQEMTAATYAVNCLQYMSPGNLDELSGFMEILPNDLIRFAIDEACGNGAPRWAYASRILQGYVRDGIRTVGDAKAAKDKRSASKAVKDMMIPQAHNFTERANTDEDYASVLIDLTKGAE